MAVLIEAWSQILAIPVFSPREINTLDIGVQAIARDAVAASILSLPTFAKGKWRFSPLLWPRAGGQAAHQRRGEADCCKPREIAREPPSDVGGCDDAKVEDEP